MAQWASFSKKLQKLITLDPAHIFLFPIQGKGKIARGIRIWTEKFDFGFLVQFYPSPEMEIKKYAQFYPSPEMEIKKYAQGQELLIFSVFLKNCPTVHGQLNERLRFPDIKFRLKFQKVVNIGEVP